MYECQITICVLKSYNYFEFKMPVQCDNNLYRYNTNSVCVSVKYRRPNGWTDHDQIWDAYADRSENGSYLKKLTPRQPRGHFGGFMG